MNRKCNELYGQKNPRFISKDFLAEEARDELNKMKEIEQEINRDNLIYKTGNN